MNSEVKLPKVLSGISGEYFVAAELSRLGYIASITLRNSAGIDIMASNASATKTAAIQVKTNQSNKKSWLLRDKAETFISENHFYIFVNLATEVGSPEYHIVPSEIVAEYITVGHAKWLKTPGRKGQAHRDTSMRQFEDRDKIYLNKWELLGLGK